jgi:hypothetical protein
MDGKDGRNRIKSQKKNTQQQVGTFFVLHNVLLTFIETKDKTTTTTTNTK